MDSTSPSGRPQSAKISVAHAGKKPAPKDSTGEFLFQIFCAVIFLSMIGLVSYNAFLRYVFRSSFPPSEEWARFLFIYITFFGAIEAFYRHKHIAVDLVTDHLHGLRIEWSQSNFLRNMIVRSGCTANIPVVVSTVKFSPEFICRCILTRNY